MANYRPKLQLPPLDGAAIKGRIEHLKNIVPGILTLLRAEDGLAGSVQWSKTSKKTKLNVLQTLEEAALTECDVPLKACVGFWVARLMASKYWCSVGSIKTDQQGISAAAGNSLREDSNADEQVAVLVDTSYGNEGSKGQTMVEIDESGHGKA